MGSNGGWLAWRGGEVFPGRKSKGLVAKKCTCEKPPARRPQNPESVFFILFLVPVSSKMGLKGSIKRSILQRKGSAKEGRQPLCVGTCFGTRCLYGRAGQAWRLEMKNTTRADPRHSINNIGSFRATRSNLPPSSSPSLCLCSETQQPG